MYNILCVNEAEDSLLNNSSKYNILNISGSENIFKILQERFVDVIILNLNNNFDIAKQIRSQKDIDQQIDIIFLTQQQDEQTIKNVFKYGNDFLIKPFNEFELEARLDSHLENVKLHKKYEKEIIFNQSVLDSQQNIIFIHDDDGLVNVNRSFYQFFNVSSIEEFETLYGTVASLFMEYENHFSLHVLNNNKPWLTHVSNKESAQYDVLLMNFNTFEPETFIIDVNPILYSDKFVVTLTNVTELTTKSKQFELRANYDSLTNLYNRNKFNEFVELHYNLFKRYKDDVCFAIFDIDYFKAVNDTYGHIIGDETLIRFSKTINNNIRKTDIFARWGGEEFTLLMPKTKLEDAYRVADNLRKIVQNVDFKTVGQKTCSIGVTQFREGDTIKDILVRADEALYEAKENGRNKVCKK